MKIVCAIKDSPQAIKALAYASKLCSELKKYELLVLNVIALTKVSSLPFLDHMEGGMNIQVEEDAEKVEKKLENLVRQMEPKVEYEYFQIEGNGTPGFVFGEYLKEFEPDLIIVGQSRKKPLETLVLGSFTDYCLKSLPYPVTVVRDL